MRNYKDSDYALNKYSEGIVYKFTDVTIEVTLEDYLRDNPDKTEADFMELKTLSDEIYYQQDRQEQRTSRLNVSINGLEETEKVATPSVDTLLLQKEEEENVLEAAYQLLHSGKFLTLGERTFFRRSFPCSLTISYRYDRYISNRTGNRQRHVRTRQDDSEQAVPSDTVCGSYALWWSGLRESLLPIMILLLRTSSSETGENASPSFEKE